MSAGRNKNAKTEMRKMQQKKAARLRQERKQRLMLERKEVRERQRGWR